MKSCMHATCLWGLSLMLCLYICMHLCMYVCMYVCMHVYMSLTGLQLKYTSLCIVYKPSGTCPPWCTSAHDMMEDLEERRRRQVRKSIQRYRRPLSDKRRQYDSERKRLASQQQSNSLCLLIAHERDRQRTAWPGSRNTTQQRWACINTLA